jgi:hypothetical protein
VREYWGRSASPTELPALRSLSDVLWGFWNRDNSNVKNIRYYIVKGIVNEVTRELLGWILQQRGEEMKVWPGLTLDMEGSEGRALLGMLYPIKPPYYLTDVLGYLLMYVVRIAYWCDTCVLLDSAQGAAW